MNIIPKLNLNDNIRIMENNSIINAENINVSDDGLLQSEYDVKINETIGNALSDEFDVREYKIIYCIECPEELIIFVNEIGKNYLTLFRYNEKEDKCILLTRTYPYNFGKIIGTFVYNKNNLIIAISEYSENNSLNIPLKVLNLGEFNKELNEYDKNILYNDKLHPINPEVIIPNITYNFIQGNTYKGWHYIFVRYKISNNTYTQWFFTNESIFIDESNNDVISKYIVNDGYFNDGSQEDARTSWIYQELSNNTEICSLNYQLKLNNLDNKYEYYQIGIIIISKLNTKAYISDDIRISNINIKFENFNTYDVTNILNNYYNYYNVKTLESFNNKLYISNYLEKNDNIDVSNITLDIVAIKETINDDINEDTPNEDIPSEDTSNNKLYVKYEPNTDSNKGDYITGDIPDLFFEKQYYEREITENIIVKYNYIVGAVIRKKFVNIGAPYDEYEYIDKININEDIYLIFYISENTSGNKVKTSTFIVKTKVKYLGILNYDNFRNYEYIGIVGDSIYKPWIEYKNNEKIEYYDDLVRVYTKTEFENLGLNITSIEENNFYTTFRYYNVIDDNGKLLDYMPSSYNWEYDGDVDIPEDDTIIINVKKLNKFNIDINEYYSFYIHFINKYGEISKGISFTDLKLNLNSDNVEISENKEKINIYEITNYKNKKLLYFRKEDELYDLKEYKENNIYLLNCKINNLPEDYIGYFISYEELDKRILYTGLGRYTSDGFGNNFEFYSEKFNFEDTINLNFNKIHILNTANAITFINKEQQNNLNINVTVDDDAGKSSYKILKKKLSPADSLLISDKESINSTKLLLELDTITTNTDILTFCMLYNDNYLNKYVTDKNLIICSNISYDTKEVLTINTKTAINTTIPYIYYFNNVFYDNTKNIFKDMNDITSKVTSPYFLLSYRFIDEMPFETLSYKNKPNIIVFPETNIDDETKTTYKKGTIIELADTIDLYKQNQYSYAKSFPISLDYVNKDLNIINKFNNTIRRSEAILDESDENNWRKFNPNIYKNIPNNKGEITKIINIGNGILIHTKNSLFVLDGSDSIKTSTNDKIQLASIDIWDINVKELIPSILGYGGLNNSEHSVAGNFGYIWYDNYDIFMLNGNYQIKKISEDIKLFLGNGEYKISLNSIFDDITNSRIIFSFNTDIDNYNNFNLTFSYKTNTFISFLTYLKNSYKIFNTKTKTYLCLDGNTQFYTYDLKSSIYNVNKNINESKINIIYNNNYDYVKVIESVAYSLNKKFILNSKNNLSIIDKFRQDVDYYAGDELQIISKNYDTGIIKININGNNINNPNKLNPFYWDLGKFIFNNIRNKYKNGNIDEDISAYDSSLVYGNYFILSLTFQNKNIIQLTSVDFNVSNV